MSFKRLLHRDQLLQTPDDHSLNPKASKEMRILTVQIMKHFAEVCCNGRLTKLSDRQGF